MVTVGNEPLCRFALDDGMERFLLIELGVAKSVDRLCDGRLFNPVRTPNSFEYLQGRASHLARMERRWVTQGVREKERFDKLPAVMDSPHDSVFFVARGRLGGGRNPHS